MTPDRFVTVNLTWKVPDFAYVWATNVPEWIEAPSPAEFYVAFLEVAAPLVGNVAGLVTGAQAIKGAL